MAEQITLSENLSKKEKFEALYPQIQSLVSGESDILANLANICAALKYGMNFFWVGFYFVKERELVLGPFQGPVACTRIAYGKGVCGASWKERKTFIVPDVYQFPGHIACSSYSKSEIVIPVLVENMVKLILDVDSDKLNDFDNIDKEFLERIAELVSSFYQVKKEF